MKQMLFIFLIVLWVSIGRVTASEIIERTTFPLTGSGWALWLDTRAQWKNDELYLPYQVTDISKLPNNPPTGGWRILSGVKAIPVSVPGTVEEYMTTSDYPTTNDFLGVSWWFRDLEVPVSASGK